MHICSGVRSSRPAWLFSFGLLNGLRVRPRRPRLREATADFGLKPLATAFMSNPSSCLFEHFIQRRAAFPGAPRCAPPSCRPIWAESRPSSIARPSRAPRAGGSLRLDRFRSVRRSRSSRSPAVRCYHEQPGIIRNHIQERAVHFFGSPASQTVRFVLWRVGGQ
jgi:hypothetical protein